MSTLKTKPKAQKPLAQSVKFLPVADMQISKLNMRHGKTLPNIDDIYPSILKSGVNQSLLVRREGKKWGVIAGRRRLFALKRKAKETGKAQKAPCIIMESGQAKAAREASLLENVARLPATAIEQYAAFKALSDSGQSIQDIANIFVIELQQVKKILALASLKPDILDLLEQEKIGLPTARGLTLATLEQQEKWLALFHNEDEYAPLGGALKDWLTGGAQIETTAAWFDLSEFTGTIITDLFGETEYFADPDAFWPLQNHAISKAIEDWKADGWSDVIILERGDYFDTCEHGKREKEQGGKIYLRIGHDGTIRPYMGYLPKSDIKKIDNILGLNQDKSKASKSQKLEMSGPMKYYIALHRHSAIRSSLLGSPSVALRLTLAHMLAGSEHWEVKAQPIKARKESTTESVRASKGYALFEAERAVIYELLGTEKAKGVYQAPRCLVESGITELFAKLLELDDATVMRIMTFAMAESLAANTYILEAVTYAVPVDMNDLWSPDDAFFDLLRDKTVINAMVADIAGEDTAKSNLTETGKVQKNIIRNRIAGHGVDSADTDWRPRWMQIPPSHYIDQETCPPSQAIADITDIMMEAHKEGKNIQAA